MAENNNNQQNQQWVWYVNQDIVNQDIANQSTPNEGSLNLWFQTPGIGITTAPSFTPDMSWWQSNTNQQQSAPIQSTGWQTQQQTQQGSQTSQQWQWVFAQNANQDIINMWQTAFKPSDSKNLVDDMSQTLKERLIKAQKSWQQVDSQLRDQIFSDIVSGMGWRVDLNNPDVVELRDTIMQWALRNFQKDSWDEVYTGMQSTFEKTQILSQISNEDIARAMNTGTITYRDIRGLQIFDPEKYKEVIRINNELKRNQSSNATAGSADVAGVQVGQESDDRAAFVDSLAQEYGTEPVTIESSGMLAVYDQMLNSDSLKVQKDRLTEVNSQVAKLQNDKRNLYKKLENKITDKAILDAVYRDQVEDLNFELSNLLTEQSTLQSAVNAETEMQKERFWIMLKEYEIEQERELKMMDMNQKEFNRQIQILQSNMTPEMKQLLYQQSVSSQATLLWYDPETAMWLLQYTNDLSLFTNNQYEMTKMDDNTVLYWNPNDPTDRQVVSIWWGGVNVNWNAAANSFWNQNNITYGLSENDHLDFDWNVGDPLRSFVSGTVTQAPTVDKATGNVSLEMVTANGDLIEFNHLDPSSVWFIKAWDPVNAWQVIGFVGNTWNVKDGNGNRLRKDGELINPQAIQQWLGSHVDLRIIQWGKWGVPITWQDALNYIQTNAMSTNMIQWQEMLDIVNNMVSDPSYGSDDREFVLDSVQSALQKWDLNQVRSIILTQTKSKLDWQNTKQYTFLKNFYWWVNRLQSLLQQYEDADWNMWLLNWSLRSLKTKANLIDKNNPQDVLFQKIVTEIESLKDELQREQSGAALSTEEQKFYKQFFPGRFKSMDYANIQIEALLERWEVLANSVLTDNLSPYQYSIIFPNWALDYIADISFR